MPDRLTPLDATFLELEQEDDCAHMHIGAALVFDPRPDGSVPTVEALRANLDARLGQLPRYRHKLSEPRTGGLRWPAWEDDDRFDLSAHVRHATLPAPGDESELCEWLGDYWSHRLDRARPLWEVVLVDGLAGGRWALATKTHHAMVDGVGSIDAAPCCSTPPEPEPREPRAAPTPRTEWSGAGHKRARERHGWWERFAGLRSICERAARYGADITIHPARPRRSSSAPARRSSYS